jgi:membrane-associated phospholipid phosphatase
VKVCIIFKVFLDFIHHKEEKMFSGIYELSIIIIQALQNIGDWFIPIMKFFTFLGVEEFYLLIMPVLIWMIDYNFGLRIGVVLLLNSGLNNIFKMTFREPRPFWVSSEIQQLDQPTTDCGIPSGHSMTPKSIYGLVAVTLQRRWVTVVMALLIFFIGLSRMTLGVHFLQDVLVGWAFGLIFLWLYLRYEQVVINWFGRRTLGQKIGTVFAISLSMVLLGAVVVVASSGYEVPQDWQANIALVQPDDPVEPFSLNGVITSGAALFGLAVGAFWVQHQGGISNEGEAWQRIVRFLVGLVGVAILWQGLGAVFPGEHDLFGYSLRFLRYTLVGLWISGLAPLLFIKLKLAKGM